VDRFIKITYEICLWIAAGLAAPKILFQYFFKKKYHDSLWARLGFKLPEFDGSHPLIWIHAVSVGETKAAVSLARELKLRYPTFKLAISSITETGHAEAIRSFPFADYHFYLPFDFSFLIKKMMRKATPALLLLCESDFWYNFLHYAKKEGALLALINGKISQESARHFKNVRFFSKKLFNQFDVLCIQNKMYEKRFLEAGGPVEKMKVTGNLKLDDEYPRLSLDESAEWRKKLGILPGQLVLTIGSSHDPEEKLCLGHLKDIWKTHSELKVILVPRHPERFKEVEELLESEKLAWISFTDIHCRTGKEQVILMDAMGLLRMCYQLADLALVAGSFTPKVGGHNILEPCWYEKPVLFGPHMHTQVELVDLMLEAQAGVQTTHEELGQAIERWLNDPFLRQRVGQNGYQLIKSLRGSTTRTLAALDPILQKKFPSNIVVDAIEKDFSLKA
jgi:3-deoxy-D-manno-octulosonic-acid transferase